MCGIYAVFGSYDASQAAAAAATVQHRGPDNTQQVIIHQPPGLIVFHRLSIMDPTSAGDQPFVGAHWTLVCNGEIYNAETLWQQYLGHATRKSHSDCEVLWQLLESGVVTFPEMVRALYGVYAIVAVDHRTGTVHAARDRVGVRPLFWVCTARTVCFASEPCALQEYGRDVAPFPPDTAGYVTLDLAAGTQIWTPTKTASLCDMLPPPTLHTREDAVRAVRQVLEHAVKTRVLADRPIACMLSGGVDSSAVAALVARFSAPRPVHTFSIGLEGSTDLRYARRMAQHLGSVHHEVLLTEADFLAAVPEVIAAIQSYDVTTVRASTPMYLLSRYIRQHTDFKVIFSGEGPDEVCGSYLYFHASPSADASEAECRRLVRDMHYFDVLRADRCTARWGLEVRVPLLAVDFIRTYWSIDAALRVPYQGIEKWIFRQAVADLLPPDVAWRPKEAYSDGVSSPTRSWSKMLQEYVEEKTSEEALRTAPARFPHHTPRTKEALWIREQYERLYPHMDHLIPYQWLPRWVGDVKDPSARVLPQYQPQ